MFNFYKHISKEEIKEGRKHFFYEVYDKQTQIACAEILDQNDGTFWLNTVYVKPDYRGKGLAKGLMNKIIEKHGVRKIFLKAQPFESEEEITCPILTSFYKKFGFKEYGVEHKMVRDAIV